jgi:hypothetical protein
MNRTTTAPLRSRTRGKCPYDTNHSTLTPRTRTATCSRTPLMILFSHCKFNTRTGSLFWSDLYPSDPPKSAKKPIRVVPPTARTPSRENTPKKRTATPKQTATSDTQPTPPVIPPTPRRSGRTSKARAVTEQKEREEYAQQFFDDLNKTVFGDGLPSDTKLDWNVRLLTTAGRARWHK